MFDSHSQDSPAERSCSIGVGAPLAGDAADAQLVPRVVTTGRKINKPVAVDDETGERVEIFATNRGVGITRHLDPLLSVSKTVALVDAIAFSVVPPDEKSLMPP